MSHFVLYLGLSASLVQRCEQMCKHMFSHIDINIDQDQALLYGLNRTTISLWLHIFLD